jgi:hypothetical protein
MVLDHPGTQSSKKTLLIVVSDICESIHGVPNNIGGEDVTVKKVQTKIKIISLKKI